MMIPGPWPFFWAPTRLVVSYSACQLVEGEVLLWSRSCGELLELEVEPRPHEAGAKRLVVVPAGHARLSTCMAKAVSLRKRSEKEVDPINWTADRRR